MADSILTIFEAETADYKKKLDDLANSVDKLTDKEQAQLAKSRLAIDDKIKALRREQEELKKLEAQQKRATTPAGQKEFQNAIDRSKLKIQQLTAEIKNTTSEVTKLGSKAPAEVNKIGSAFSKIPPQLKAIGALMLAAFSVGAIKSFVSSSIGAFAQQEKVENQLLSALKGRRDVQQSLIKQAQELQKTTLFGDEETIRAQALVAAFVKEEEQIKTLIPLIQDFAAAKGIDLASAADLVTKTFASSTNALGRYGLQVEGTAGSQERLLSLTRGLEGAFGGQAQAIAQGAGILTQISNIAGDITEKLGGLFFKVLAPGFKIVKDIAISFDNFLGSLNKQSDSVRRSQVEFNAEFEVLKNGNITVEQRRDLIDNINTKYKDYLPSLLTEKSTLEEITAAQEAGNKALTNRIVLLATQEQLEEKIRRAVDLKIKADELAVKVEILKGRQQELNAKAASEVARQGVTQADQNLQQTRALQLELEGTQKAYIAASKAANDFQTSNAEILASATQAAAATASIADEDTRSRMQRLNDEIKRLKELLEEQSLAGNISTDTLSKYNEAVLKLETAQNLLNKALEKQKDLMTLLMEEEAAAIAQREQLAKATKGEEERIAKDAAAQLDAENSKRNEIEKTNKLAQDLGVDSFGLLQEFYLSDFTSFADFEKAKREELKKTADEESETLEQRKKNIEDFKQALNDLAFASFDLFRAITDAEIASLEERRNAQNASFDAAQENINNQLERGLIAESIAKERSLAIQQSKAAAEAQIQKKINEQKRKQAVADRALAIANIIQNTAQAITKTLALTGFFGIALTGIVAAIGALQLATVLSQPIPQFAEGTPFVKRGRNKKGKDTIPAYLNEGERVSTAEQNAKYFSTYNHLENPRSKYRSIFDAIEKDRLEDYVFGNYVAPQLRKAKTNYDQQLREQQVKMYASSIVKTKGIDEYGMLRVADNGFGLKDKDLRKLAKYIAEEWGQSNPYRR